MLVYVFILLVNISDLKVVSVSILSSLLPLTDNIANLRHEDFDNFHIIAADCEVERRLICIVVSSVVQKNRWKILALVEDKAENFLITA